MREIKVKIYNSNAEIIFNDFAFTVSFDGWSDFSREENEDGLIEEIETKAQTSLTEEERVKFIDEFNFALSTLSVE